MAETIFGVSQLSLLVGDCRSGAARCSEPRLQSMSSMLQSDGGMSRRLGFGPSFSNNSITISRLRYSSDDKFFRGVASFAKAAEIEVPIEGDYNVITSGDGGSGSNGGDGGGKGGGGGDDGGKSEEGSDENGPKMSMSQKLTLGYAALVGAGGVIGYRKSGSQKSLLAGVFSALLLYFVYTLLPSRPALASAVGLGKRLLEQCGTDLSRLLWQSTSFSPTLPCNRDLLVQIESLSSFGQKRRLYI